MTREIQKVSDVGVSHPSGAHLGIQTSDRIGFLRAVLKQEIEAQRIGRQHSSVRRQNLTAAQRKEQLAQDKARAWTAKKLLRSQDRAWRKKKKREA
jgi:hypothetical protein